MLTGGGALAGSRTPITSWRDASNIAVNASLWSARRRHLVADDAQSVGLGVGFESGVLFADTF